MTGFKVVDGPGHHRLGRYKPLVRIHILQDSVQLMRKYPRHPIWKHALFSDPEYVDFASKLDRVMAAEPDPTERRLELAMPDLTHRIDALHRDLRSALTREIEPVRAKVSKLETFIEGLCTGTLPLQLRVAIPEPDPTTNTPHPVCSQPVSTVLNPPSVNNEAAHLYKMCRGIETVVDLWREWKEGLGGAPSVEFLEQNNGAKWCQGNNERRFFNRRKRIIDAIVHRAKAMNGGE